MSTTDEKDSGKRHHSHRHDRHQHRKNMSKRQADEVTTNDGDDKTLHATNRIRRHHRRNHLKRTTINAENSEAGSAKNGNHSSVAGETTNEKEDRNGTSKRRRFILRRK